MIASALFPAPVQPGDVLRGKYRVERLLGQGGMAYVISAWHLSLEQRVAIKLLLPETVEHPGVIERFLREARAASKLEGANVSRVIDVDTLDSGSPFIVMEYLEGADLAHVLAERGPLPPHQAAAWIWEACGAIVEAHGLGIIHRDLKPANLFLAQKRSGEPVIKVLDFGISKLLAETSITQTDVGMGSAEYMSPEQLRSAADVDPRCDLWSLGITLYELTTGVTPFRADGVGQVAVAVLTRDPVPPSQLRPDLPLGLEAVILRCLEKEPEGRYASAAELADALAPFASPAFALPPAPPAPPSARAPLASAPLSSRAPQSVPFPMPASARASAPAAPRRIEIVAGVAVAVLAVAVVVAAFVMGRSGGAPAAGAPPSSRFQLDGATLRDTETRLTWQRTPAPGTMDWANAKDYCAHQRGRLRLPEIDELVGLLAVTAVKPPIDPVGFPTTPVDVYWSASPAGPGAASVVHFSTGRRATSVISGYNRVRCVH